MRRGQEAAVIPPLCLRRRRLVFFRGTGASLLDFSFFFSLSASRWLLAGAALRRGED